MGEPRLELVSGWVVEVIDDCTCSSHFGAHEPYCGTEPVMEAWQWMTFVVPPGPYETVDQLIEQLIDRHRATSAWPWASEPPDFGVTIREALEWMAQKPSRLLRADGTEQPATVVYVRPEAKVVRDEDGNPKYFPMGTSERVEHLGVRADRMSAALMSTIARIEQINKLPHDDGLREHLIERLLTCDVVRLRAALTAEQIAMLDSL